MLSKLIEETGWSAEIRQCIGEVGITMGTEKGQALADAIKAQNAASMTLAYEEGRKAAGEDTKRLDYLDECNRRLNAYHGTTYNWKLILNHNVTRLMSGDLDIDLNDAEAGNNSFKSCREAIDERMKALTSPITRP